MSLRALLFDTGGTLVATRTDVGDPWRELVLAAVEREFGPRAWAAEVHRAQIRSLDPDKRAWRTATTSSPSPRCVCSAASAASRQSG